MTTCRLIGTLFATIPACAGAAMWQETASEPTGIATVNPRVRIATTLGDIVVELDGEHVPLSVDNFVRYVEDGFYDGTIFHRVIPTFTILGGSRTPDMEVRTVGLRDPIRFESSLEGMSHDRGTIALHRLGNQPESARAEFFINVVDNPALNRLPVPTDNTGLRTIGRVVEGMDVVDAIGYTPVDTHPQWDNGRRPHVPLDPVIILSMRLVNPFDHEGAERIADAMEIEQRKTKAELQRDQEVDKLAFLARLDARIQKIEEEAGHTRVETGTGLIYVDHRIGTGASPRPDDTVHVIYRGSFLDGKVFDDNFDKQDPVPLPMEKVLPGWKEGLATMKVGGKRTLIIPPKLGYGVRGHPGAKILPEDWLFYDIELVAIGE